jgi:hypothetical protein
MMRSAGEMVIDASAFCRLAISTAAWAQSLPLGCMRTSACSSVSQVRMPLAIGTPVCNCTSMMARQESLETTSKVISITTNHGAKGDQRIVLAALRHGLQNQRNFQRAGHIGDGHVGIATPRRLSSFTQAESRPSQTGRLKRLITMPTFSGRRRSGCCRIRKYCQSGTWLKARQVR